MMLLEDSVQAPNAVIMIRPHHFVSNPETMIDNSFQNRRVDNNITLSAKAFNEVTQAAKRLSTQGIEVHLFEDQLKDTPDSVFPNNWFSTHHDGYLIKYPMYAKNRRLEYRQDVIDLINKKYGVREEVDLRSYSNEGVYLEGTGSIVFDHNNKLAYACRSKRTDEHLLDMVCYKLGYSAVVFDAFDKNGIPIYHTNVLMCIGTDFVMISLDMVADHDKTRLVNIFNTNNQKIIALSESQIQRFCGNAIELQGNNGLVLALSQTAYDALTPSQKQDLETFVTLVPLNVPTIESAGGSVRCMIAGIHHA